MVAYAEKRWAVGYTDFFDNCLSVNVVRANDWKSALEIVMGQLGKSEYLGDNFPDDIDKAKEEALDGDWQFEIVEIPYEAV